MFEKKVVVLDAEKLFIKKEYTVELSLNLAENYISSNTH